MKLREYEGKALFKKYGILVPESELFSVGEGKIPKGSVVLKAQVLTGDRKKHGGILMVDENEAERGLTSLLGKNIQGEIVDKVLAEEKVDIDKEFYASISYDTETRGPVLAISNKGGSGIEEADIYPLDITLEVIPTDYLRECLEKSRFDQDDTLSLSDIIDKLWKLFVAEYALLAEINPIFKTKDGRFIAGDAKVIIDDEKVNPGEKRFVKMDGDIAVLASGGGASMLNMDYLLEYGGRPANYTEYSGNPKADVVKNLTRKVLEQPGINGLWAIGGTANFTDVYETFTGFLEGLESLSEKPKYPILIRRDGPRGAEAREMVRKFAKEKGYNIHVYGNDVPMFESARMIVGLARQYKTNKS